MTAIARVGSPEQGQHSATVLVVEDEVLIRSLLAEELRGRGLKVLEASSADEGLRMLRSSVAIDLLITDIEMPGRLDGTALVAHARRLRPGLPVIVASGQEPAMPESMVDAAFSKPYGLTEVGDAATRLIAARTWDRL